MVGSSFVTNSGVMGIIMPSPAQPSPAQPNPTYPCM